MILIPQVPDAPEPVVLGAPISDKDQLTSPEPFTDLPVEPMVSVRAVPQLAVVMLADPLKFVPLMERVVWRVVAVPALPEIEPVIVEENVLTPATVWSPLVFTVGSVMLALPLKLTPLMVLAV